MSSYFVKTHGQNKTRVLVANIKDFRVIVTVTETQSLLLESELIKQHMPRYNILLKDSKSYPYIFISHDKHPRVGFYRGKKYQSAQYFGPYPSAHVVRGSLNLLKKIFKVRQCSNSTYRSRSRPCLFLSGKGRETLEKVSKKMQLASQNLEFELAARLCDQLIDLRTPSKNNTLQVLVMI